MNDIQIESRQIYQSGGGAPRQQHPSEYTDGNGEKVGKHQSRTPNRTGDTGESLSKDNVDQIAENLNQYLKSSQTDLRVEIDRKTDTTVFKIIRKSDKKVIKQIPPEELLEIESRIRKMAGSLLDAAI